MFEPAKPEDYQELLPYFSKRLRAEGILPAKVLVERSTTGRPARLAMYYELAGKWPCWAIRVLPEVVIEESWSSMLRWLREIVGDKPIIEAFPTDDDIINTAPMRWFFVVPSPRLPEQFNLNFDTKPTSISADFFSTAIKALDKKHGPRVAGPHMETVRQKLGEAEQFFKMLPHRNSK